MDKNYYVETIQKTATAKEQQIVDIALLSVWGIGCPNCAAHCYVEPIQKTATTEEQQIVDMALFSVWGMGCPNCAARVRNNLLSLNGVVNVEVVHTTGTAGVAFNPNLVKVEMLIDAVASAGNDGRHVYGARLLRREVLL